MSGEDTRSCSETPHSVRDVGPIKSPNRTGNDRVTENEMQIGLETPVSRSAVLEELAGVPRGLRNSIPLDFEKVGETTSRGDSTMGPRRFARSSRSHKTVQSPNRRVAARDGDGSDCRETTLAVASALSWLSRSET